MARRRRARAQRAFPARLARFRADEWKQQPPDEALRVWGKARMAFFQEHGGYELGMDFLDVLQGNVEARRHVR